MTSVVVIQAHQSQQLLTTAEPITNKILWNWITQKYLHLYREKQERLEKIRQKLYAQYQQKVDDEDERIHNAVIEAETRAAKEDAEKEEKMKNVYKEMAENRADMVR